MSTSLKTPVALAFVLLLFIPTARAVTHASDVARTAGYPVDPTYVAGNPTCTGLGFDFGFKPQPEPPPTGTYTFPGTTLTVAIVSDGIYVDWTSALGIDAVIVKGGPNANVYTYDPPSEAHSDAGLHAPINPSNGRPYGISHLEFCYDFEVGVSKTAVPSFNRTWSWTIEKTGDQTEITLAPGQVEANVNYSVTVTPTFVDSDWAVEGVITITNPAPMLATLASVSDVLPGASSISVNCGVSFPYLLAAGGSLTCVYDATLPGAADGTNTATVTTIGMVGGGSATADYAFSTTTPEMIDECINVTDDQAGDLGTFCAGGINMQSTYSMNVAGYVSQGICDAAGGTVTTQFINTASFVTIDRGLTGEDDWTVTIYVPCDVGCTLTQGYWKTHSDYGPAPYDDAWTLVGGPDATFFLSGQSYYQVLWTPPAGNVYYNLAHQYIAAVINVANGASDAAVASTLAAAEALFNAYTPAQVAAFKGKAGTAFRQTWTQLASILDDYNNGLIGPGHCTETATDVTVSSISNQTTEAGLTTTTIKPYPNPFNPVTTFEFTLPESVQVTLTVFDVLGRRVATLWDGAGEAGVHRVSWNADQLPSGTYVYLLQAGSQRQTGTLLLIK